MKYPYNNEGLAQCLKETCNTDSPVLHDSFELKKDKEVGGTTEQEFHFRTEDGSQFRVIIAGKEVPQTFFAERHIDRAYIKALVPILN